MKDKFGDELKPNDIIAYATGMTELKIGIVTKVSKNKVGVRGIFDTYSFQEPRLGLMGTLIHSDRILIIPFTTIPVKTQKLLLQAVTGSGDLIR